MTRMNKYKKLFFLIDEERKAIDNYFRELFGVDRITDIKIYIEDDYIGEPNKVVCEIEGFDEETLTEQQFDT